MKSAEIENCLLNFKAKVNIKMRIWIKEIIVKYVLDSVLFGFL